VSAKTKKLASNLKRMFGMRKEVAGGAAVKFQSSAGGIEEAENEEDDG
jgi:uncharacterized protein with ACT and thioredoxin-like domain